MSAKSKRNLPPGWFRRTFIIILSAPRGRARMAEQLDQDCAVKFGVYAGALHMTCGSVLWGGRGSLNINMWNDEDVWHEAQIRACMRFFFRMKVWNMIVKWRVEENAARGCSWLSRFFAYLKIKYLVDIFEKFKYIQTPN